jgi:hypothetical protein
MVSSFPLPARAAPYDCVTAGKFADRMGWGCAIAGVKSYEVSLESQIATVVAEPGLSYETVLKTISKTGKKVNSGEADGVEQSIVVPA